MIQLYHNFVTDFEHKISPLKLGHLAVAVSSRYGDRTAAAAFMESVLTKLTEGRQPGRAARAIPGPSDLGCAR